jgi:hypothetical protein
MSAYAVPGGEGIWTKAVPLTADAKEYYVSADGKAGNTGAKDSPWDIVSVVGGKQKVTPGSVVWLREGRYIYPVRSTAKGGNGFTVSLSGVPDKPVHLRAYPGEHAIIDGGFQMSASNLWVWDLDFNIADDWRPKAPSPQGQETPFDVPTGVLNIVGSANIKIVNCISHHNTMGVGFWKFVKDSEMHGCTVYDNGFLGTDRPHGPALYTQNETGTPRLITDNMMAGNFSLPIQAYGSKIDQNVNDFTIEGNICFAPRKEAVGRTYALCGGTNSKNMVVRGNLLYGYALRMGDKAGQVSEGNTLIRADIGGPTPEKNTVVKEPVPATKPVFLLRPNKYDPRRANLVVSNWARAANVDADVSAFLTKGDTYRILNPLDFHGKPLAEGTFDGRPVSIPVPATAWALSVGDPRELGVFIIMKSPAELAASTTAP